MMVRERLGDGDLVLLYGGGEIERFRNDGDGDRDGRRRGGGV